MQQLMWDFCQALPRNLSREELALFEALYQKQRFLGGLPLILLRDRFEFLQEVILENLQDPEDQRRSGILLRLLHYYGAMVSKKREGDRQYKKQHQYHSASNRGAPVWSSGPEKPAVETPDDLFQKIASHLRKERKAACRCKRTIRWRAKVVEEETTLAKVVLEDPCQDCGHTEPVCLTRQRFREIGERLLGWRHRQER
jgi:hypothetical protein